MSFWPLLLAFTAAHYYSIWGKRWYWTAALSVFTYIYLRQQALGLDADGTIILTLVTVIFSWFMFMIVELPHRR